MRGWREGRTDLPAGEAADGNDHIGLWEVLREGAVDDLFGSGNNSRRWRELEFGEMAV